MFKAVVIELVPLRLGMESGPVGACLPQLGAGLSDDAVYPASLSFHHLSDPVKRLAKIDRSVPEV